MLAPIRPNPIMPSCIVCLAEFRKWWPTRLSSGCVRFRTPTHIKIMRGGQGHVSCQFNHPPLEPASRRPSMMQRHRPISCHVMPTMIFHHQKTGPHDLDSTYRDIYGDPILRMAFDFHDNEHKMSRFIIDKAALIAGVMKTRSGLCPRSMANPDSPRGRTRWGYPAFISSAGATR
jgi:hypothetical protein